jgi:hypothetical protein
VVNVFTICVGFGRAFAMAAIKPLPINHIDVGTYGL